MHPTFPCPNPACTHTFSPQAVQGSSSLVCPKCGTVFQFSSTTGAPARPSVAAKKPAPPKTNPPPSKAAAPSPQPVAKPAPPPPAAPVSSVQTSANFDFNSTPEMVIPRSRRAFRRPARHIAGWIFAIVAGILVPTVAVWGGLWLRHYLKNYSADEEPTRAASAYNARFVMPGKPWTRDKDIQRRFNVHIGMKSPEHNNGVALLFKDYKDRLPSDAEMLDEAVGRLRAYFKGLEWELQTKDGQTRLANHAAQMLQFQGDDTENVTVNGECYMLAFRGYGYWFFIWAPLGELERDGESIRAEWARLRNSFSLDDERKGWKAKPREALVVSGKKAKYRLAYVKGLWTREASEDEDPQMDMLLRGQEPDPERKPLAGKDATVQVLVLPPQPELPSAAAAALAYVKQREMKLYERTVFEPVRDKNGEIDRDAKIGAETGRLSKWHVKNTEELERFLSIAVVDRPDGVVVLIGDCLWERRDFWDQEFAALFKTFKVR
jgi:hypothetical protein